MTNLRARLKPSSMGYLHSKKVRVLARCVDDFSSGSITTPSSRISAANHPPHSSDSYKKKTCVSFDFSIHLKSLLRESLPSMRQTCIFLLFWLIIRQLGINQIVIFLFNNGLGYSLSCAPPCHLPILLVQHYNKRRHFIQCANKTGCL